MIDAIKIDRPECLLLQFYRVTVIRSIADTIDIVHGIIELAPPHAIIPLSD